MISINKLNLRINESVILKGVNLNWSSNEIIGVVGLNGAGKTSLFKSILQLGYYKNDNIGYPKRFNLKNDIGYMNETRGIFIKETVLKNIEYFASLNGLSKSEGKKRAQFWLEFFKIGAIHAKKIYELSKGNQQKIQFITSIIGYRKYMILDEPFSGVDPINAELFVNAIRYLNENLGIAVLYSSHQMSYVEELADKIVMVKQGEIVESGRLSDIKKKYLVYYSTHQNSLDDLKMKLLSHGYSIYIEPNSLIVNKKQYKVDVLSEIDIADPSLSQIFKLVMGDNSL